MTSEDYAQMYQKGFPLTVRFLLSKGVVMDQAEEIAQAAWVRGWEARNQLRDQSRLLPWVNSIAFHGLCNDKHKSSRHQRLLDMADGRPGPVGSEHRVEVSKLLRMCNPLDRSILIHRFAGGYELKEIAVRHGMKSVAARVRLHRTIAALRKVLLGEQLQPAA